MSEYLAPAAQALNAPEAIVQRSAEARAKASGASVDDVLQAWAGGGSVAAAASAPPAAASPVAEETPEPVGTPPAPEPSPAPAPPPATEAPPAPAAAPAAVAVAEPEEQEAPEEAAPLRERVRISGRVGALTGVAAAVLLAVFAAPWILPAATLAGEEGSFSPAFEVAAGNLIGGTALVSLVVGIAIAAFARAMTGRLGRGMRLESPMRTTIVVGVLGGAVFGALVGAVAAGAGEASPLDDTLTVVPLVSALAWAVIGWAAGGWLIGAVVQAAGVPAGVTPEEAEESTSIRRRLAGAYGLPVAAVLGILIVVLPAAYVFISFPEWAPLIAVFIAASVLGFAGLSASRPGVRISAGEFLVAAAGVAVVVIIVVAVLNAQGAGHAGGEDHGGGEGEAAVLVVGV